MRRALVWLVAAVIVVAAMLWPQASANSLLLDSTSKALELETGAAVSTDYVVSYADHTTSAFTPGMNQGNVASATTTTILSAPSASTQRQVKWVSIRNRSTTTPQTVTLKLDVSGTDYHLTPAIVLAIGESLTVDAAGEVTLFDRNGRRRVQAAEVSGYTGRPLEFLKIGTASEAVGVQYSWLKDSGVPGAWVPGTPGLNGATVDCSTGAGAAVAGAPVIANPATGGWYLSSLSLATTTAHYVMVADLQWYNTGIVVSTTTAQGITFPTPVSRDDNGSNAGAGVQAALYATAAIGGGAVTNTTLSYTDQDGNSGATATIASWPATAVVGTFVPFQLAAGDSGIRSIESITLGTTYSSGSLSLLVYRPLAGVSSPLANVGGIYAPGQPWNPGLRLWSGTCAFPRYLSSATTATTLVGVGQYMER